MSAPQGVYLEKCLINRRSGQDYKIYLAKPLSEYVNEVTFKNEFYVDEIIVAITGNNEKGIEAFVEENSFNERHHNMETRKSHHRLRINSTTFIGLNDGGLNTLPDVSFILAVAYSNCLIVNTLRVKSAYYIKTNSFSASANNDDVSSHIEDLPSSLPKKREEIYYDSFLHPLIIPISGLPDVGGGNVELGISATNDEGTYTYTQNKVTVKALADPTEFRIVRHYTSLPNNTIELGSNGINVKFFQYQSDKDITDTNHIGEDIGGDGVPDVSGSQPQAYTSIYTDNIVEGIYDSILYFPEGWFTMDTPSFGPSSNNVLVTFFHVKHQGYIDCWYNKLIEVIRKTIIVDMIDVRIGEGSSSPYSDFPYMQKIRFTRANDISRQDVSIKCTIFGSTEDNPASQDVQLQFMYGDEPKGATFVFIITLASSEDSKESDTIYIKNFDPTLLNGSDRYVGVTAVITSGTEYQISYRRRYAIIKYGQN